MQVLKPKSCSESPKHPSLVANRPSPDAHVVNPVFRAYHQLGWGPHFGLRETRTAIPPSAHRPRRAHTTRAWEKMRGGALASVVLLALAAHEGGAQMLPPGTPACEPPAGPLLPPWRQWYAPSLTASQREDRTDLIKAGGPDLSPPYRDCPLIPVSGDGRCVRKQQANMGGVPTAASRCNATYGMTCDRYNGGICLANLAGTATLAALPSPSAAPAGTPPPLVLSLIHI